MRAKQLIAVATAALAVAACAKSDGDPAASGTVEIVSPNGGEIWASGSTATVTWQSVGDVGLVDLLLYKGELQVATIAQAVENSGSFDFDVPAAQAVGGDYRVRVASSVADALFDDSDATFSIDSRTIELTALTGGETITAGEAMPLTWTKSDNVETVLVELFRDGVLEEILGNGIAGESIDWTVPADLVRDSTYTVRVSDVESTAADESGSLFTVLNWQHRRPITVTSVIGATVTDFPVLIELDPAEFDFADALPEGEDIRFARFPDRRAGFDVPHFIESWSATTGARIWVRIPSIPGNDSTDVFMFHGLDVAPDRSDFDETFPVQVSSTTLSSVGGTVEADVFVVEAGDTVDVVPGALLSVDARIVIIAGTLDGDGAGFAGGAAGQSGSGPGPGVTAPSAAGAGGGGYGGGGGRGGFDPNDTPGSGGASNGSAAAAIIEMGSGGGGSALVAGGNGGAGIAIRARNVTVAGAILAKGEAGTGGVSQCGGGGAGGGVIIEAAELTFTGLIEVQGGSGGPGAVAANDGGGGGGGGRVKLLVGDLFGTGTVQTAGGAGGFGGDQSPGLAGANGTMNTGAHNSGEPLISVGAREAVFSQ